ncbi:MAG: monofunctional biosynthetic peptidoglycan transglycosylase [Hyphomonadaceae bacterium]|nr:MAG: monofunctional biosynthetic peptidoglycan transglycosylase [Hyphomonadaceae bacterium]KAF0185996.1 MAG: monofunctional biosynthetic peptidoglycan transglycosylase [Hyphomonadaceae bacterium]
MNETIVSKTAETTPKTGVRRRTKRPKPTKRGFGYLFARFIAYAFFFVIGLVIIYRFIPMPATYLMVQRAFEGDKIRYHPVSLRNISRNMVDAAIAAEDARFCYHNGFEWEAMKRAAKANKAGRKLRGASTISQQTAKNVFLWPARSYIRKGLEAGYTALIELFWPKRRIMEAYLNVAEMGDGIFGAEAAARYYYHKSAKNLSPSEAARIIAILPSPRKWSVKSPSGRVSRRANRIVRGAQTVRSSGLDACIYK